MIIIVDAFRKESHYENKHTQEKAAELLEIQDENKRKAFYFTLYFGKTPFYRFTDVERVIFKMYDVRIGVNWECDIRHMEGEYNISFVESFLIVWVMELVVQEIKSIDKAVFLCYPIK